MWAWELYFLHTTQQCINAERIHFTSALFPCPPIDVTRFFTNLKFFSLTLTLRSVRGWLDLEKGEKNVEHPSRWTKQSEFGAGEHGIDNKTCIYAQTSNFANLCLSGLLKIVNEAAQIKFCHQKDSPNFKGTSRKPCIIQRTQIPRELVSFLLLPTPGFLVLRIDTGLSALFYMPPRPCIHFFLLRCLAVVSFVLLLMNKYDASSLFAFFKVHFKATLSHTTHFGSWQLIVSFWVFTLQRAAIVKWRRRWRCLEKD